MLFIAVSHKDKTAWQVIETWQAFCYDITEELSIIRKMSNKNKLKHQAKEDILKNQEGDVDTQATVDNEANAEV